MEELDDGKQFYTNSHNKTNERTDVNVDVHSKYFKPAI